MIYPTTKLTNEYYFLNKSNSVVYHVIYNIAARPNGNCGEDIWTLIDESKEDTEKNREKWYKKIPSFKVEYKETIDQETPYTKYYWLQNLIKEGDVVNNNKNFLFYDCKLKNTNPNYVTKLWKDSVKETIADLIAKGYNFDKIKETLPFYCFAHSVNEPIKMNGKDVYFDSIEYSMKGTPTPLTMFSDNDLLTILKDTCNNTLLDYANNLLSQYDFQVKENGGSYPWLTIDNIPLKSN